MKESGTPIFSSNEKAGFFENIKNRYMPQRVFGSIIISKEKKELLFSYGWYKNIKGGYAHPHAKDYMTSREIAGYNLEQLEYKLKHGSEARLPKELLEGEGDEGREPDFDDGEMV